MIKKIIIFIIIVLNVQYAYSQLYENKIDSIDVLINKERDKEKRSALVLAKIDILVANKKFTESKELCNSLLERLSPKKHFNLIAKTYYYLGVVFKKENKYDIALNNFYNGLSLQDKITENSIIVDIYFEIGYVYMLIGNIEKAIFFLQKSNDYLEPEGNELARAKTVNNIGYMYEISGKYDLALEYYNNALAVFEKFDDKKATSFALNNIGALYREIENYDKAIEYYEKSLKIKKQLKDTAPLSTTYNNLGVVYQKQKKYDQAIEYYNKALEISKKYNDLKSIARTINNIGKVYESEEEYEKALDLYFESLEIKDSINDNHGKILSFINIGKVYRKKEDYNKSIEFSEKGIKLADSLGFVKELSDLYKELSGIYEISLDFENALKFHKKYTIIKDTLLNKEKQKNIDELEISYQTERREKELEYLKIENASKETILRRNGYLAVSIIFTLIFISLYLYILNNRKKLRIIHKSVILEQKLLRSQMNPHFIFNSLTAIQAYVFSNDALEVNKYISDFAKLMRLILENSREDFISVGKEIETLEYYLKLQQIRFDDKFRYKIKLSKNINIENDFIPPMLAQPIIENAIEHGISNMKKQGCITIYLKKENKQIILSVTDNGKGFGQNKVKIKGKNESYALKIIEERLSIYNKKSKVNIKTLKDKDQITGTEVSFKIPLINHKKKQNV